MAPIVGYTLGDVARRFGVAVWQVRRLFERRILPEPGRIGAYRLIHPDDLARVEAALRQAGYLTKEPGHAA